MAAINYRAVIWSLDASSEGLNAYWLWRP